MLHKHLHQLGANTRARCDPLCSSSLIPRSTRVEWVRQDMYSTSSSTQSSAANSWCWDEKESGTGGEDWRAGPATWTRCMDVCAGHSRCRTGSSTLPTLGLQDPGATGSLGDCSSPTNKFWAAAEVLQSERFSHREAAIGDA